MVNGHISVLLEVWTHLPLRMIEDVRNGIQA